jgi:hypothetical protein
MTRLAIFSGALALALPLVVAGVAAGLRRRGRADAAAAR